MEYDHILGQAVLRHVRLLTSPVILPDVDPRLDFPSFSSLLCRFYGRRGRRGEMSAPSISWRRPAKFTLGEVIFGGFFFIDLRLPVWCRSFNCTVSEVLVFPVSFFYPIWGFLSESFVRSERIDRISVHAAFRGIV